MNRIFLRPATPLLLIGILIPIVAGVLHAETVIEDKFSLKDRGAGLPLNGTPTETGDMTWEASKNVILNGAENSGYISLSNELAFSARVPIPEGAHEISVEALLRADPKNPDNSWVGVGIGNTEKPGCPTWGEGLMLNINHNGYVECNFNPERNDFASMQNVFIEGRMVPEFIADGLNKLKLVYNAKNHTVSAWVNDAVFMENVPVPTQPEAVEPKMAGFSGFNQNPNVKAVASFRVAVSP